MGPGKRPTFAQCDCVAGPADGAAVPKFKEGGCRNRGHKNDRLAARSIFLRDESRVAVQPHSGWRQRAEEGGLALGTVDSWLIFKLTGGKRHVTDVTNASRTMLLDLHTLAWSDEMLGTFDIPRAVLPEVCDSAAEFGQTDTKHLGSEIPIRGVAGDQQAALFGQACFGPGDVKSTYGTGCFALVNTGGTVPISENRLLATCGYRAGGKTAYAIEGSIFTAGAVVQWLRDALGCIRGADEIEALASTAKQAD